MLICCCQNAKIIKILYYFHILAKVQSNLSSLHHIYKTTWSCYKQMATTFQVTYLLTNVGPTIHDAGADFGAICKLGEQNLVLEFKT